MKNKLNLILFSLTFIFLFSCSEEDIPTGTSVEIPQYLEDFAETSVCAGEEFHGAIHFYTYSSPAYQNALDINGDMHGKFFNDMLGVGIDKGLLKIDDTYEINANAVEDNIYEINLNAADIYGQSTSIKLIDENNTVTMDESVEFPKGIVIDNSSLTHGTFKDITPQNNSVNWSSDANNTAGIVIIITYDPENALNYSLKNEGHDQEIRKVIFTQDTGTYTFTNSDFSGMPMNAHVEMSLARGICDVIHNNSGEKILVTSYIATTSIFQYLGLQ